MKLMSRIDRISAWLLLIFLLLYFITGFDTVKRVLLPQVSSLIHLRLFVLPVLTVFAIHTSYAVHLALKRWKIWNVATQVLLSFYIIGICTLAVLFYIL